MLEAGLYNMDCMEGMRQFPDGFFDLAVVDPPYGDGGEKIGGGRRFGGWFDRYKVEPVRAALRPIQDDPEFLGGGYHGKDKYHMGQPEQAAGGLSADTTKKSLRGTLHRGESISTSFSASRAIRSYGAGIILICHRHGAF